MLKENRIGEVGATGILDVLNEGNTFLLYLDLTTFNMDESMVVAAGTVAAGGESPSPGGCQKSKRT
jgi:hypothetical protein